MSTTTTTKSSPPAPTYIYKLIPSASPPPSPLPDILPLSDIDQKSGFIHLSTAHQVPNTLKYFFANEEKVYVLRINYDAVEADIRWEDPSAEVCGPRGGEGMFPHLYSGGKLGKDQVESVAVWDLGQPGAGWEERLQAEDVIRFLVY